MIAKRSQAVAPALHVSPRLLSRLVDPICVGIFAVLSLLPLSWFRPGDIVDAIDMGLPFNAGTLLREYSSVWDPKLFAGTDFSHLVSMLFPYYTYFAIAEKIGGVEWAQRAEFVGLFFLMFVSAYFAARSFGFRAVAAFATALAYVFNFYVMVMFHEGFILIALAYGLLPLNVVLFRRIFSGYRVARSVAWILLVSVLYAASASSAITILVVFVIPAAVSALVFGRRYPLKITARRFFLCLAGYALANSFWLLPMLLVGGGMSKHHLEFNINDWPTMVKPLSTFDTMRMLNWDVYADILPGTPYWTSRDYFGSVGPLVVTGVLACAPLLLFFLRGGGKRALFCALYAVGLVGSLGFGPPFGAVFTWLVKNVPGFLILRSTNIHFGSLEAFGAAFAFGFFINTIRLPRFRIAALGATCVMLVIATMPMWRGSVMEPTRGIAPAYNWRVPRYYKTLDNEMANLPSGQRTAILPQQYAVYAAYTWGAWTEDPIIYWLSHDFVTWPSVTNARSAESSSYDSISSMLNSLVYTGDSDTASAGLWALGVGQVVYRSDIDKRFYSWQDEQAEISLLATQPFLKAVASIGPLRVYRVTMPVAPPLYRTNDIVGATFPFYGTKNTNRVFLSDVELDWTRGVIVPSLQRDGAATQTLWEESLPATPISAFRWIKASYLETVAPQTGVYRLTGMLPKDLSSLIINGVHNGTTRAITAIADDESGRYVWLRKGERLRIIWTDPHLPQIKANAVRGFQDRKVLAASFNAIQDVPGGRQVSFLLPAGRYFVQYSGSDAPLIFGENGPFLETWESGDLISFENPRTQNVSTNSQARYRIFAVDVRRAVSAANCAPLSYEERYPWLYRVSAAPCAQKSVITLGQSYDRDWVLLGASGARHVVGNGYANAWLISSNENVDGWILYWPQIGLFAGMALSGLVVLGCLFFVAYPHRWAYRS